MRFYIGKFRASQEVLHMLGDRVDMSMLKLYLNGDIVSDMERYADRVWTTRSNDSFYVNETHKLYCDIDEEKHANWFLLKYPSVKCINDQHN